MVACTICTWTIILLVLCIALIAASTGVGLPIAGGLLVVALLLFLLWLFLLLWIDVCCFCSGGCGGVGSSLGGFGNFSFPSCGCSG